MALPPLYKFMGVDGAKATLDTRSFRHAKRSTFNDTEDLTIQSIFSEDLATAFATASASMPGVIMSHLHDEPTCKPEWAAKTKEIQAAFLLNPAAAQAIADEIAQGGIAGFGDTGVMQLVADETIIDLDKHLQDYRVFCVTTNRDSEKMWRAYAETHRGIALRVQPSIEKDSHLLLFRKVEYREKRPPLYEDTKVFVEDALFGDKDKVKRLGAERIIYSKPLQWQDKAEYRVAAYVGKGDIPWDAGFYADEIPELYLGSSMLLSDMVRIIKLARLANPSIRIFKLSAPKAAPSPSVSLRRGDDSERSQLPHADDAFPHVP